MASPFSLATIERAETHISVLHSQIHGHLRELLDIRVAYAICTRAPGSFSSEDVTRFDGASPGATQGATGAESAI